MIFSTPIHLHCSWISPARCKRNAGRPDRIFPVFQKFPYLYPVHQAREQRCCGYRLFKAWEWYKPFRYQWPHIFLFRYFEMGGGEGPSNIVKCRLLQYLPADALRILITPCLYRKYYWQGIVNIPDDGIDLVSINIFDGARESPSRR